MTSKRIRTFTVEGGVLELYVSDCARCGVVFGIPKDLEARRREDHGSFYCPNGHSMVFSGLTQAEKEARAARERADRLSAALGAQRDQAEAARREAAEAKASEVRLRWRVGNGVCPCCQRTFRALASHVATKHPEFVHHDLDALSARMQELLATIRRETEAQDAAVLNAREIGAHWGTVRALATRGLVTPIGWECVALTEAGWPVAEQAASRA
ncbi:hypothetical protein [Nocardioides sp. T2.26MG-1]|uniref:hypothetical protein n=1 Tax=Nocardioides sp. T2.26MG-1 TaxID=3041166 RepID=UPI0024775C03|nr:hypothetical protein [Nocardioides sp. T2.26MG-1]CAI9417222.1 hypothetical protein HIDPHFAB_02966 [Nocardioides sp. T2.26MG-1]